MALRPWNVFRKTIYAGGIGADGVVSHLPVTARIGLARARLKAEDTGDAGGGSGTNFSYRFALLLPPSALVWFLLAAARWRYSDLERLRRLEKQPGGAVLLDILGSRAAAHLGPLQIQNFVESRLVEEPLAQLRDPLLLDHERARALSRLEQVTQRRLAAGVVACKHGGEQQPLRVLEPLFAGMFQDLAAPQVGGAPSPLELAISHKATYLRIIFDVVVAVPEEDRTVPSWVLKGLATVSGAPWDDSAQGEELRSTLFYLLLASPENCVAAASMKEVCDYFQSAGMKRKEDTVWPLKAYLLSGETPDLLRRCARLINKQVPGAISVPAKYMRDTPSLQIKHDLRGLWTTALITGVWAGCRAWRGVIDANAALAMAKSCGGALLGMGVLESTWRIEERLIDTKAYFEESRYMLSMSASICVAHCAVWAWAFQFNVLVPFLFCRLAKDSLMDSYRSYEL